MNATVKRRLETIRKQALKEKASAILGKKISEIKSVEESYNGASVACKNGNTLSIPHEVWVLGMTEEEYIQSRKLA